MKHDNDIKGKDAGFISAAELMEQGAYYRCRRAVKKGEIYKVKHGIYAAPDLLVNNMTDVEKVVPGGVVCLYSAWAYYQLTTTIPPEICVAIEAKRKVVTPEVIPIKLYYWKAKYLEYGVVEMDYSGYIVKITDIEHSVCDAIRYRNKIGLDMCAEIVGNYLNSPTRNISRLVEYSKHFRVSKILTNYLEILL